MIRLLARTLALLLASTTSLALLGCVSSVAQAQAGIRFGAGNIFQADYPDRLSEKLADVEALGLTHVTVATAFGGYSGPSQRALAVLNALHERGLTASLVINGRYRQEQALTEAGVEAAGEAWGTALRPYAGGLLYSVSIDNEPNLKALNFFRTQGEEAAAQYIQRSVGLVLAFARGVRRTCSDCRVVMPGFGGREIRGGGAISAEYLRLLRPHVGTLLEPILHVHRYAGRSEFDRRAGGAIRWNVDYSAELDSLLTAAGWPRDVEIAITETNVKAWGNPEQEGQALRAMVQRYRADPRIQLVTFFTPWREGDRGPAPYYDIDPGDPRWNAVRDVAQ